MNISKKKVQIDELFLSLSVAEVSNFKLFLKNGSRKSTPAIRKMAEYLFKFHPAFDSPKLTNEGLYASFSSKALNEKSLTTTKNKLKSILKDFLILGYLEKEEYTKELVLLKVYEQKELASLLEKKTNQLIKKVKAQRKQPFHNSQRLQELYHLKWFNATTDKWDINNLDLNDAANYLDSFYLLTRIQYELESNTRNNILNLQQSLFNNPAINIDFNQLSTASKDLRIQLLSKTLYVYQQQYALEQIEELKTKFISNLPKLEKNFARDMGILIYTCFNHHIQRNNLAVCASILHLYKQMDLYKIFYFDGHLRVVDFWNVVNFGYQQQDYTWTDQFIKDCLPCLSENEKTKAQKYAKALSYFYKKQYENVVKLLLQLEKGLTKIQSIRIKTLRLRALYECHFQRLKSYDDLLYREINAFKRYLKKEESLNEQRNIRYQYFLTLLSKISKMPRYHKSSCERLLQETEKLNPAFYPWIIKKVKERGGLS